MIEVRVYISSRITPTWTAKFDSMVDAMNMIYEIGLDKVNKYEIAKAEREDD